MTGSDSRPIRSDRPAAPPIRRGWGRRRWAAVAVAAAAVVLWIMLPVSSTRTPSLRSPSQNNLKWIALGAHNFHAAHGAFPPHVGETSVSGPGNPAPSWQAALLPYMDEAKLWRAYDVTKPFDHPANAAVAGTVLKAFIDPHPDWEDRRAEGGFGLSHYAGNVRVLGPGGTPRLPEIADGATQTLYAGQIGGFPAPWADPDNLRDAAAGFGTGPRQFGGPYAGGTGGNFALCDGSVVFLSKSIDPAVLAALGTPDGGEETGDDF